MEQVPSNSAKHEREFRPRDANLESVRNTSLHEELELSNNPTYEQLTQEKNISVDDLYQFSDQEGFLYVKIHAGDIETRDDLLPLLNEWGLEETNGVGYGTGPTNVGFTKAASVIDKINTYDMGDNDNLSLYIPVAYS